MPETVLEAPSTNQQHAEAATVQVLDRIKGKGRVRHQPIKPRHLRVARNIANNMNLGDALRDAGYAESVCKNPSANISKTPALVAAITAELGHYTFAPETRARLIRQRLLKTVIQGNDANANRACELAGKDKEIRMFEADTQVNILNAFVPAGVSEAIDSIELGETEE